MKLASILWQKTASYEKAGDTAQILERYLTAVGGEYDDNLIPAIDAFTENVAHPNKSDQHQLRYHLDGLGLQRVSSRLIGSNRLATYWDAIKICKGNVRFLKYAYSYYDVVIESVEYADINPRMDYGTLFDIGQPMDNSGANRQKGCTMYLTGPSATLELTATLAALAIWNQSPYINWTEIYYNDVPILNGIIVAHIGAVTAPETLSLKAGELALTYDPLDVDVNVVDGLLYITIPDGSGLIISRFILEDGFLKYVIN